MKRQMIFVTTFFAAVLGMAGAANAWCKPCCNTCAPRHHYTPRHHHVVKKAAPAAPVVTEAPPVVHQQKVIERTVIEHQTTFVNLPPNTITVRAPCSTCGAPAPVQRPVAQSCCPRSEWKPGERRPICKAAPLQVGGSARTVADGRCAMILPNGVSVTGYKWDDNRCHVKPPA